MEIQYALGRKITRASVEAKEELVKKITERANSQGNSRMVSEGTAVKRYVRFINSMMPEKFEHLFDPTDSVYFENEPIKPTKKSKSTKAMPNLTEINFDNVEVKLVKMKDKNFDPNLFVPIKSGTPMDKIISNKEGLMPATNTICLGDPGIGKTTVLLHLLAEMKKVNPEKKFLFVSGEMTDIDLAEYMERIPGADEVDTFFPMDYEEDCLPAFLKTLNMGWDVILYDSFDEIKETLNEYLGMTSTKAEKWMIDEMIKQNQAKNERNVHTAFLAIQQVTKGGKFVGSNKLKHNTTAMLEMRYDSTSKEPKLFYTKNRRGNTDLEMFFSITEDGVSFNITRFTREMDYKKRIEFDKEHQDQESQNFKDLFKLHEDEDGNFIAAEPEQLEEEELDEETEDAITA